jgi:hypothetical protein
LGDRPHEPGELTRGRDRDDRPSLPTLLQELYPEVVDAREEKGGVPSRLIEDRGRLVAGKEGTP